MKPMLFHSADPATIAGFVSDDDWILQQKVDGMRCVVHITKWEVRFLTRDGRELKSAAAKLHFQKLRDAFKQSIQTYAMWDGDEMILDGELMTDQGLLILFDAPLLRYGSTGSPQATPEDAQLVRWSSLVDLVTNYPIPFVRLVSTAQSTLEKLELAQWIESEGAEGVIAKRVDSPYDPGARVKHSLKLKFTQTADVIVSGKNVGESKKSIRGGDKLNYELAVIEPETGRHRVVGFCSSIGKADVEIGSVIEVEYLYVGAGGKLTQPRMVRPRPDKWAGECTTAQLKFYSKAVR